MTVTVTAGKPTEDAFSLSRTTVPVGTVVFDVVNRGERAHAFSIAGKKTPLLAPGHGAILTVAFAKPGSYLLFGSRRLYRVVKVLAPPASSGAITPATTTTTPQLPGSIPEAATPSLPCASPTSSTVKVTIFDFGFTLSPTSVPCGTVTFQVTNTGAVAHNFDVESIAPNGVAALNGGLNLLGGESQTQTVTYTRSGTFRYQCDLHWIQGQMIGTITVTQ